ncbi:Alpha/beta hydrolase [Candidatus Xenohaliotis californiensis]|uniref:Alpha/beta hydrolase n=1 Tax=Candidatus Xenohaliotis californiensis TaxID=84677 RepID=A0ABP0EWW4_9RICK|nr:Alpha/beta hydrolase [Candidatus Xenohaliotis californiensis]
MVEVLFNGPAGRIEGVYHKSPSPNAPVALVLHPHPTYGGTMNNKIVYYLYKTFALNNFSVLRINFRGVGKSTGEFSKGAEGLNDAAAAMDWLQSRYNGNMIYWIAGVSYGAWIAMQLLMRRPEIVNFVSVSPPIGLYDFSFLSPCPTTGLIIQGDNDNIVKEENVSSLISQIKAQKSNLIDYYVLHGANHFFDKETDDIIKLLDEYIKKQMHIFNTTGGIKTDKKRRRLKV